MSVSSPFSLVSKNNNHIFFTLPEVATKSKEERIETWIDDQLRDLSIQGGKIVKKYQRLSVKLNNERMVKLEILHRHNCENRKQLASKVCTLAPSQEERTKLLEEYKQLKRDFWSIKRKLRLSHPKIEKCALDMKIVLAKISYLNIHKRRGQMETPVLDRREKIKKLERLREVRTRAIALSKPYSKKGDEELKYHCL